MRELMNASDSHPGHRIAMQVWELGDRDQIGEYLDIVMDRAKKAENTTRYQVARRLRALLPSGL